MLKSVKHLAAQHLSVRCKTGREPLVRSSLAMCRPAGRAPAQEIAGAFPPWSTRCPPRTYKSDMNSAPVYHTSPCGSRDIRAALLTWIVGKKDVGHEIPPSRQGNQMLPGDCGLTSRPGPVKWRFRRMLQPERERERGREIAGRALATRNSDPGVTHDKPERHVVTCQRLHCTLREIKSPPLEGPRCCQSNHAKHVTSTAGWADQ